MIICLILTLETLWSYTENIPRKIFFDTLPSSDNPLSFQKNLLEEVLRVIMTIDDKIRDEKLQYDISTTTAKRSELLSGTIDKYEHLNYEEILPPQKYSILQEVKFSDSFLGKEFEK